MAVVQVPYETKVERVQHIYHSLIDELRDIDVELQHSYQLVEHYFVVCMEIFSLYSWITDFEMYWGQVLVKSKTPTAVYFILWV